MTLRTIQKLVLITLFTLSISVFADDKIDWTGFYGSVMIGRDFGHVGQGHGILDYSEDFDNYLYFFNRSGVSMNGWSGGLKLGFNKQFDSNIIGIELGVMSQDAKSKGNPATSYYRSYVVHLDRNVLCCLSTSIPYSTKIQSYETLSGRFGHVFDDKTLVYLKAGLALGQIKRDIETNEDGWTDSNISIRKSEIGGMFGGGIEHKITPKFSIRADYEFVDFGKLNFKGTGLYENYSVIPVNQSNSIHFSNLSAGVSYAF